MRLLTNPADAYARVAFDARVAGGNPRELVLVCYEQLSHALARAQAAYAGADNRAKSEALTRALTAIAALQMGIDPAAAMAAALDQFYAGARRVLLDNVIAYDPAAISTLASDVFEVSRALGSAE
jgi:flagellin-specific chaperone FliS